MQRRLHAYRPPFRRVSGSKAQPRQLHAHVANWALGVELMAQSIAAREMPPTDVRPRDIPPTDIPRISLAEARETVLVPHLTARGGTRTIGATSFTTEFRRERAFTGDHALHVADVLEGIRLCRNSRTSSEPSAGVVAGVIAGFAGVGEGRECREAPGQAGQGERGVSADAEGGAEGVIKRIDGIKVVETTT